MIQRVTRVGVGQMAKVLGVLYFLLGILMSAIFAVVGSMIPATEMEGAAMFGTGMLIALPLLYGVAGLVFGALIGWLYNLVAGWTGGFELEFEPGEA
jgi:hypothetical protein